MELYIRSIGTNKRFTNNYHRLSIFDFIIHIKTRNDNKPHLIKNEEV